VSRSNPHESAPNPAVRWFEWSGEHGRIRYYDKTAQMSIDVPLPFTFLLLDELASVRGWHDASESGIYSNEVRDTTKQVLVVKTFKGETLAEGYYKAIKDKVNGQGGRYVANCYIAAKVDDVLSVCSLRFKGAALGAWMEFRKAHRGKLFDSAVRIHGFTEGKKGRITFRMPSCELYGVTPETQVDALALDKTLQAWLDGYFSRRTHDQAEAPQPDSLSAEDAYSEPLTDNDIPF
jgi:hypothetical protein